jgi:putative endonuclease
LAAQLRDGSATGMGELKGERQRAYVYFLTNDRCNVLYVGSTENLKERVYHHKHRLIAGFTRKYNVHRLVYFEGYADIESARNREKELKGKNRWKKDRLIESMNADWRDLSLEWV